MADEDEEKQEPAGEDSLDELREKRTAAAAALDEGEDEGEYTLPGDDEIIEDLDSIKVLPKQPDEFICQNCFLVHHASQRYKDTDRCRDCSE